MPAALSRTLAFIVLTLSVIALGCTKESQPPTEPKTDGPQAHPQPQPPPGPPPDIKEDGLGLEFYAGMYTPDLLAFLPGDTVVFIAECKGLEKGIVEFSMTATYHGNRPAVLAPQIAADYAKDAKAADGKYKDRYFVVRGVYLGRADAPNGLKGCIWRLSNSRTPEAKSGRGTDHQMALVQNVLNRPAELTVTAETVEAEQKKPEADAKYIRKMVKVSGKVLSMTRSSFVDMLYIGTGNAKTKIECMLLAREPWNQLSFGQEVTVFGHCRGVGDTFFLGEAVIADRGPEVAKVISAVDLAKEYASDPAKTNGKYHPKAKEARDSGATILVSGEVVAWTDKSNQYFFQPLVLKGADGVRVVCTLDGFNYPEFEAPIGAKVQVMGRYRRSEEKDVVIVSGGFLRYTK